MGGCDSKVLARGWCSLHYRRWLNHGSPAWISDRRDPRITGRFGSLVIRKSVEMVYCPKHPLSGPHGSVSLKKLNRWQKSGFDPEILKKLNLAKGDHDLDVLFGEHRFNQSTALSACCQRVHIYAQVYQRVLTNS